MSDGVKSLHDELISDFEILMKYHLETPRYY